MAIAHLQGKRTGRPRGSKSLSPAQRGLAWASKHLGQSIEPPTPAAKFFVDMAREEPAKFMAAVGALDAANRPAPPELANTDWTGSEVVTSGVRKVSFQFRPDGTVLRTDDHGTYEGTWTEQADQVTIDIPGGTYHGTIQGNTIRGECMHKSGKSWPFRVTRQKSPPMVCANQS